MHFKNTQLSVPEIAKMLRVDAIIEGSVVREGRQVRVHTQPQKGLCGTLSSDFQNWQWYAYSFTLS